MSEQNLIVDVYSGDLSGRPDWNAAVAAENVAGAIVKATEGTAFDTSWLQQNWPAVKNAAGDRYGTSWFRGAYHFLIFGDSGADQADFYLGEIEKAGGFDVGDIIPIVDVELGNDGKTPDAHGCLHPRHPNQDASAQQIIDCTSAWAERVKANSDQQVMLYGNLAMAEKGITDRMNCDWLWVPRYTPTLPAQIYTRAGWDLEHVALWQYCGDGTAFLAGYPSEIAGFGKVDISAVLFDTLRDFQNSCCSQLIKIDS